MKKDIIKTKKNKSKKVLIAWAKKEIKEYEKFIKHLEEDINKKH